VFVNAGIAEDGEWFFGEELGEMSRKVVRVDVDAAFDTTKLAIYYLRKNGNEGGSIVLTASLAGYLASAGAPVYSAAKHGMLLLFDFVSLGVLSCVGGVCPWCSEYDKNEN
jgi:NAD(P)-dependent dehydrogenase (short-subunit alcohol dehydrogenase family)